MRAVTHCLERRLRSRTCWQHVEWMKSHVSDLVQLRYNRKVAVGLLKRKIILPPQIWKELRSVGQISLILDQFEFM